MIKVGFLLNFPLEYKGGINYLKNLFYAVNKFSRNEIIIVLFVDSKISKENLSFFSPYCRIIKTSILNKNSILNIISRFSNKYLKYDFITEILLLKHKIDVVSHSNYISYIKNIKSVNWIPDFQSLHYPQLLTNSQLKYERKLWIKLVVNSHKIVLSSFAAFSDFKTLFPNFTDKVEVLQFVSQNNFKHLDVKWENIYTNRPYFYLPNQFWEHKNHIVVWKAINYLKTNGKDVILLASGHMKDFRNNGRLVSELIDYINKNNLTHNIKLLGLIPYEDVLNLIKYSTAVINPSLFEGWSSTVEESKAFNKNIILSDIPVHREQDPERAFYFDPNSYIELAEIMINIMDNNSYNQHNYRNVNCISSETSLDSKTRLFSDKYTKLIKSITSEI